MKTNRNDFLIPGEAVEACGFDTASPLCFHAGPDALIVASRDMTAMQAVNAIDALTELSTTLICALLNACDRCDKGYPDIVAASSASLASGHSPKARSLRCVSSSRQTRCAGPCRECFGADDADALSNIPEEVLEMLVRAGVCLGSLEELLMDNEVIVHG